METWNLGRSATRQKIDRDSLITVSRQTILQKEEAYTVLHSLSQSLTLLERMDGRKEKLNWALLLLAVSYAMQRSIVGFFGEKITVEYKVLFCTGPRDFIFQIMLQQHSVSLF